MSKVSDFQCPESQAATLQPPIKVLHLVWTPVLLTRHRGLYTNDNPSTRIKDAGIAIRHSRGGILFYTASPRNESEGMVVLWADKLTLRKRHFLLIEKSIADAKQKQKDVPDLLESIMRPTCLVKEELWLANPFEKNSVSIPLRRPRPRPGPLRRRMENIN